MAHDRAAAILEAARPRLPHGRVLVRVDPPVEIGDDRVDDDEPCALSRRSARRVARPSSELVRRPSPSSPSTRWTACTRFASARARVEPGADRRAFGVLGRQHDRCVALLREARRRAESSTSTSRDQAGPRGSRPLEWYPAGYEPLHALADRSAGTAQASERRNVVLGVGCVACCLLVETPSSTAGSRCRAREADLVLTLGSKEPFPRLWSQEFLGADAENLSGGGSGSPRSAQHQASASSCLPSTGQPNKIDRATAESGRGRRYGPSRRSAIRCASRSRSASNISAGRSRHASSRACSAGVERTAPRQARPRARRGGCERHRGNAQQGASRSALSRFPRRSLPKGCSLRVRRSRPA